MGHSGPRLPAPGEVGYKSWLITSFMKILLALALMMMLESASVAAAAVVAEPVVVALGTFLDSDSDFDFDFGFGFDSDFGFDFGFGSDFGSDFGSGSGSGFGFGFGFGFGPVFDPYSDSDPAVNPFGPAAGSSSSDYHDPLGMMFQSHSSEKSQALDERMRAGVFPSKGEYLERLMIQPVLLSENLGFFYF